MSLVIEREPAMEKKEVTSKDVYEHIAATKPVPVKAGRKCVDGRYQSGEDGGRLARPGGDFGYVMALLAAARNRGISLTPKQAVDAVYNAVTKNGGQFFMHTDEHAEHSGLPAGRQGPPTIGCGHIAGALAREDIAQALTYLRRQMINDPAIHMVHLKGHHAEKAVLKVIGTTMTINSRGRNMFFVYDYTRDRDFLRQLVKQINIGLEFADVQQAADEQTMATLQRLVPGQPIFEINVDGDQPIVLERGRISNSSTPQGLS